MKTFTLITTLLVVFMLAACSPFAASVPTITHHSLLPTPQPTPFSALGSAHGLVSQTMQSFQDHIHVGGNWGFYIDTGETALLDQANNVMEIQDAQGRVKLENLGGDLYRFYAWQGGYDLMVGSGKVLLTAQDSYTFHWSAAHGNPAEIEVRLISTDELLGYLLIIPVINSAGSFTGYEKPVAFIDSNNDGLVSIPELDTALKNLGASVQSIAPAQPAAAGKLETDINAAYDSINSGAIAAAYSKTKQLEVDVGAAKQSSPAPAGLPIPLILLVIAVVVLIVLVIWLARRSSAKKYEQRVSRLAARSSKSDRPLVNQGPEKVAASSAPAGAASLSGLIVCPNCKMKVFLGPDGTCPSCHAKISV